MELTVQSKLLRFLQEELGVPAVEVATAQKILGRLTPHQSEPSPNLLPIVLWQYGLVSFDQLTQVLDWLDRVNLVIN